MSGQGAHALPAFIIAGAQKCGTSSLYAWLVQHPRIEPAMRKEVHFFDLNFERGVDWYRSHFPLQADLDRHGALTGEATPYYLFHPHAVPRMAAIVPATRVIILLRDPVERALSHYFQSVRKGFETLPVAEAMAAEEARIDAGLARMTADPACQDLQVQKLSYKRRGRYVEQLQRCLAHFPRDQLLVLESEALFASPAATLGRVFSFLELEPFVPPDMEARNVGAEDGTSMAQVPGEVRASLRAHFAPFNADLCSLLGTGFSWTR